MADPADVTGRVLVKLRDPGVVGFAARSANLRPLYADTRRGAAFAVGSGPEWYVADLDPDLATAWDLAHAQVADRLGVSQDDVLFAEPDQVHAIYPDPAAAQAGAFAAADRCAGSPQDPGHGKAVGPDRFAWHLEDGFSQLRSARGLAFTEPRTRIAHLDTGYDRRHETAPAHIAHALERSFVDDGHDPTSAQDPDNFVLPIDNSGHGTGTIGILAGNRVSAQHGEFLGGAPEAEILPLRVADSVVLLRTSALARAFDYATSQRCDVATLSMGGLPSRVWSEAVDRAYENGLLICAAAGNHIGVSPPKTVVFPARYDRVLAVAGVMADGGPYADLDGIVLEGSFGPSSAMDRALAAFTPNIPWPVFGCDTAIRLDGEGTSAATPQVAAAAALWIEKYKGVLPRDWRRIEAVRHALFTSARRADPEHFGNGILQAQAALAVAPRLPQSDREKAPSAVGQNSFALFRLITGLGLDAPTTREEMLTLELAQRALANPDLAAIVPDLESTAALSTEQTRGVLDAIIADKGASGVLRRHAADRYPVATGRSVRPSRRNEGVVPRAVAASEPAPKVAEPPRRRLRVYTVDPSLASHLDSVGVSEATLEVPWERLAPPAESADLGEYFTIADVDPTKRDYGRVDLDDSRLIATDGWPPSEGNPHFHQQMVYAVARNTVEHFERALGRPIFWRPGERAGRPRFRQRLVVSPHALVGANAFYSPDDVALAFGYFDAAAGDPGNHWPGTRVYTCLSFDIIAHETTHAVLDGMHRRFRDPTNVDVLALHEGFGDLVALLQHFTLPALVEQQIARTRGDLEAESLLGSLAVQVGQASGRGGPLREAIGRVVDGTWVRSVPDPSQYDRVTEPHARGAILVAAVFDAFIEIFKTRTADLLRLATGGTGILPNGAIHPDLVRRLAAEAGKSADHVLTMAIRALDYLPPVDVTFFDVLRALITADYDLVRDDRYNYRVAFVEAFRRRGVHPDELSGDRANVLSVETLRWQGVDEARYASQPGGEKIRAAYGRICAQLRRYADAAVYVAGERATLWAVTQDHRRQLTERLTEAIGAFPAFAAELGIDPAQPFEVEELRRVTRVSPDGRQSPQVVVSLTQTLTMRTENGDFPFRGGTTMIVDLLADDVIYSIGKSVTNLRRLRRNQEFVSYALSDPLRAVFFGPDCKEPFAALHALATTR